MKKVVFFSFFISLLLVFLFNSCNDSDRESHSIKFHDLSAVGNQLENINMIVTSQGYDIEVKGGSGDYTYEASAPGMISLKKLPEYPGNVYRIMPAKEGPVSILFMDFNKNVGRLYMTIVPYTEKLNVAESQMTVNVTDATIKQEIEQEVGRNSLKPPMALQFKYVAAKSGELIVYTDQLGPSLQYEGTFGFVSAQDGNYLKFFYQFESQNQTFRIDAEPIAGTGDGLQMTEDLTEYYKTKYPDAGVQEVKTQVKLAK